MVQIIYSIKRGETTMRKKVIFLIFGIIQNLALGWIIYLLFQSLTKINSEAVIGKDTSIILSIIFPLFTFVIEYLIYENRNKQ